MRMEDAARQKLDCIIEAVKGGNADEVTAAATGPRLDAVAVVAAGIIVDLEQRLDDLNFVQKRVRPVGMTAARALKIADRSL